MSYHDGRETFHVRINLAARQLEAAQAKSRPSAPARNHVCIQVRTAIQAKYGRSPGWVDWDHRRLTINEVAQFEPGAQSDDIEQIMLDLAEEAADNEWSNRSTAHNPCGCVP